MCISQNSLRNIAKKIKISYEVDFQDYFTDIGWVTSSTIWYLFAREAENRSVKRVDDSAWFIWCSRYSGFLESYRFSVYNRDPNHLDSVVMERYR